MGSSSFNQPLRTATPLSIHSGHSISSSDQAQVPDPFASVDPFERATRDPFADNDPFSGDDDPFADIDPFGAKDKSKDSKAEVEFATHALSAEGVPLRAGVSNAERNRKLQVNVEAAGASNVDPFGMTDADVMGKKLNTPLIGDGSQRPARDPFDTAFAAVSLNLNQQFAAASAPSDLPAFDSSTHNHFPAFDQSDSSSCDVNQSGDPGRVSGSQQQESDSTSYNSEVSEAFGTTSQFGGSAASRGTPINPFLNSSNQNNQQQIAAQVIQNSS